MTKKGQNGHDEVRFWNVNTPPNEHTEDCPEFLQYAFTNDKDRAILATPDPEYQRQTWLEVQQIIHDNRLDLFLRVPSDLRRYRQYTHKLIEDYGSIMNFVMRERLRWTDLTPHSAPFTDPGATVQFCQAYLTTDTA